MDKRIIEVTFGLNAPSPLKIFLDVVFILTGIAADAILIGTLARFKQLKTRANAITMHLSISHLFYVASSPLSTYLVPFLIRKGADDFFLCVFDQAEKVFLFASVSFAIALALDWYAINYTTRFKAGNATIVKFVWAATLPFSIVLFVSTCMEMINAPVSLICLAVLVVVLSVLSVAFQIARYVKVAREENVAIKSAASLNMAAVLAAAWLLWLILVSLMESDGVEVIAWFLAKCIPVGMVTLMSCNDRNFAEHLRATIKCGSPVRRNQEGGDGETSTPREA